MTELPTRILAVTLASTIAVTFFDGQSANEPVLYLATS